MIESVQTDFIEDTHHLHILIGADINTPNQHISNQQKIKRDIKLIPTGEYGLLDMVLADDGDLLAENGLETAVIISLFSDQRYEKQRGHWADQLIERKSGSLLWRLQREKTQDQVLRRAEDYAQQALKWMIKQRIASKVNIEAYWGDTFGRMILSLDLTLIKGTVFYQHHLRTLPT